MSLPKMVRILAKITLLDEIVGFAYWSGVILGIFLIFEHVHNLIALSTVLIALIVVSPIAYIELISIIESAIGK